MWFRPLFDNLLARTYRTRSPKTRPAPSFHPRLEMLEERTLLSANAYVVNLAGDAGTGSGLSGDIRYCITQADQSANAGSTITFDTTKTGSTITLSHGELVISDKMTITGPGASSLTLSGNYASRLFDVVGGASLTLAKLTLSGGLAHGTGAAAEGGAIYSSGILRLSGVTLKSNEALGSTGASAFGGGIYVAGGTVTLNHDTLSNNNAIGGNGGVGRATSSGLVTGGGGNGGAGSGGGVYVASGSVTLSYDTLRSNQAVGGNGGTGIPGGNGGAASGGGLDVAEGSVTLSNDTLSNNQAVGGNGGPGTRHPGAGGNGGNGGAGSGGGLYTAGFNITLTNDTLSSNHAAGGNGGAGGAGPDVNSSDGSIYGTNPGNGGSGGAGSGGGLYAAAGTVTLNDDTLSSNTAPGGNGGAGGGGWHGYYGNGGSSGAGSGGGLDAVSGSNLLLHNTLVAANLAGGNPADIQGNLNTASSYNLIGDGSGGLSTANHNLLGSSAHPLNPLLAPLGNYGGPTQTVALLPGSPALNAGDITNAPADDQRGTGFARTANGTTDIGAFELQSTSSTQVRSLAVTGFPSNLTAGNSSSFTIWVLNGDGTVNTGYTGTVHFTSSDPKAVLPANYTFTAADKGVHTFSATLKTAGSQSITATDTARGSIAGSESGISVTPAATSKFLLSAPASVTHGTNFSVTLTVEDAYGNVVTGYLGTVHFTSSDSKATLPANYTFTASDAGVHTWVNAIMLHKLGKQKLTVTDTHNSALTATDSINVS